MSDPLQKALSRYGEALDVYSRLMQEAKARLWAMDTALEGKTGLPNATICEFCFLQLRMLCELIALGCLTAHGDVQIGKDLKKAYQADKIIRDLERLHPEFYPKAASQQNEGFTKEELTKLYWRCGDVLHRGTLQTLWSRDGRGDTGIGEIRKWKQKIEAQLGDHTIVMADGTTTARFKMKELTETELKNLETRQAQSLSETD
jgi:hypothetical protein